MELGNALFGNSRGEYPIPRSVGFEEQFIRLVNFYAPDNCAPGYGPEFENATFKVMPYYWGDCTCEYEDKENVWDENNHHTNTCYQTLVNNELVKRGWIYDAETNFYNPPVNMCYDVVKDIKYSVMQRHCAKLGLSYPDGCAVHCTCDYEDNWVAFVEENNHSENCLIVQPNFLYKPTGFTIDWYKYVFRDSYASCPTTLELFTTMINTCIASL